MPDPHSVRPARSLRLRLLLLSAISIAAALTIAGVVLTATFERHLERRVEQELGVKLLELAGAFALDDDGAPTLIKPLADPRYDQPYSGSYWQIATPDGPVLRARSLWEHRLAHDDPRGRTSDAYETDGPDNAVLYVRERDVKLSASGTARNFRLTVALDHAELAELGASFRGDTMLALGVIAAVLVLGAWLQLTLGLSPLRHLRAQIARIQQGRAARLTGVFPAEIAPLAASVNALIDRQEDLVRRARERAGDLAHGLKTPLTILTGEARRLDEIGETASAIRLREQIDQMRIHVERQLARARSHGAAAAGGAFTDATASLDRLLGLMRRMPRAEALEWSNALPPGVRLRMDPDDFGEILGNLLDNARLWARARIVVSAILHGPTMRIIVDDDGPGIPPAQRDILRGRGESNAPLGAGSGLGLAIVADVLALYATGLAIEDSPAGGCRMAFDIPGWIESAPDQARASDQTGASYQPSKSLTVRVAREESASF